MRYMGTDTFVYSFTSIISTEWITINQECATRILNYIKQSEG